MFPADAIELEWRDALNDSQVDSAEVVLWPVEGFAEHSYDESIASTHPPDRAFVDDRFTEPLRERGYPLDEEMRARVALFTDFYNPEQDGADVERELLAGVMRHELEHVLQLAYWHSRGFNLFDFDGIVDDVLDYALRNKSTLYNAKPIEQDANGAASRYLAHRFDDAPLQTIHKGRRLGELVRWKAPQPPQTLLERTLAFCLMLPLPIQAWEQATHRSFSEEIEDHLPGMSAIWQRLSETRE